MSEETRGEVNCRGAVALGTACGVCPRCIRNHVKPPDASKDETREQGLAMLTEQSLGEFMQDVFDDYLGDAHAVPSDFVLYGNEAMLQCDFTGGWFASKIFEFIKPYTRAPEPAAEVDGLTTALDVTTAQRDDALADARELQQDIIDRDNEVDRLKVESAHNYRHWQSEISDKEMLISQCDHCEHGEVKQQLAESNRLLGVAKAQAVEQDKELEDAVQDAMAQHDMLVVAWDGIREAIKVGLEEGSTAHMRMELEEALKQTGGAS